MLKEFFCFTFCNKATIVCVEFGEFFSNLLLSLQIEALFKYPFNFYPVFLLRKL